MLTVIQHEQHSLVCDAFDETFLRRQIILFSISKRLQDGRRYQGRLIQRSQGARVDEALPEPEMERPAVRELDSADTPRPHVALLGQLPYTIMISQCGGGYSRYGGLAVTRWRSDGTRDATGQFCYVRDRSSGHFWSATHQPVGALADWYRAYLATDRVTVHRADGPIETRTEIAVVPEDSA